MTDAKPTHWQLASGAEQSQMKSNCTALLVRALLKKRPPSVQNGTKVHSPFSRSNPTQVKCVDSGLLVKSPRPQSTDIPESVDSFARLTAFLLSPRLPNNPRRSVPFPVCSTNTLGLVYHRLLPPLSSSPRKLQIPTAFYFPRSLLPTTHARTTGQHGSSRGRRVQQPAQEVQVSTENPDTGRRGADVRARS